VGLPITVPPVHAGGFLDRFRTREQVIRYRDRYFTGRHARLDLRERAALRKLLSGLDVGVALDVPCGTGRMSAILAEYADGVVLADGSSSMLEVAREDRHDLGPRCLQTDINQIALASDSIDLVFCHRFLHHVHDPQARARSLSELARVSRRYVVISFYPSGLRTRWRYLLHRALGRGGDASRPTALPGFLDETARAGLRPVRTSDIRRFPFRATFYLFDKGERTDRA